MSGSDKRLVADVGEIAAHQLLIYQVGVTK
jgi:hypothetical protein